VEVPAAAGPGRRVVLAKPGLDGHDRGIKVVARALRDAGYEVIYTGRHQTPQQIVRTVIQEDAGVLGLSILSGAHLELVADVRQLMRQERVDDVTMVVGGTIPADDWDALRGFGVAAIFTPGTSMAEILRFFAGSFDEENP
jgi:methylmalonyl-CoA mutase, C-terminal domain